MNNALQLKIRVSLKSKRIIIVFQLSQASFHLLLKISVLSSDSDYNRCDFATPLDTFPPAAQASEEGLVWTEPTYEV